MSLEAELERLGERHGQLVSALPDGTLAISCGKLLEGDVRAALIIIPELVRIDVRCAEDTIHLLARSLGPHGLRITTPTGRAAAIVGDGVRGVESLNPSHQTIEVELGTTPRSKLRVEVALLTDRESGTVQVTAQGRLQAAG